MLQFLNSTLRPIRPFISTFLRPVTPLTAIRNLSLKTHKGAAKRWKKLGTGAFKRRQAGRRHGNVGWSRSKVLGPLNSSTTDKKVNSHKKLKSLLPY